VVSSIVKKKSTVGIVAALSVFFSLIYLLGIGEVSETIVIVAFDSPDPNSVPWGFNNSSAGPTIIIKKGELIRLRLLNGGGEFSLHDVSLPELDVATKRIESGQVDEVIFRASKSGTFTYICSVPGHKEVGMTGTIIVQP